MPVPQGVTFQVYVPQRLAGAATGAPTGPENANARHAAAGIQTAGAHSGIRCPATGVVGSSPPVGRLERGCPPFAHRAFLLGGPSPWTKRGQPRQALWLIRTESTGTIGVDAERVVHGLSTVVVPSHKSGGGSAVGNARD